MSRTEHRHRDVSPAAATVPNVEQIPQRVDERTVPKVDGCCLYGLKENPLGGEHERSADHVPSKSFLRKPYPTNLPTVDSCVECNNAFSGDEQYLRVLLACVLAGSADPEMQTDVGVRKALARDPRLRAEIAATMREPLVGRAMMWAPDHTRLSSVLTKNARGHLWHEHAEHRTDQPTVAYAALVALTEEQRERFESPPDARDVLPEVGSRAMQRVFSGDTFDGWTFVQDESYRFAIDHLGSGAVRVRSVIFEYLAAEVVWSDEP